MTNREIAIQHVTKMIEKLNDTLPTPIEVEASAYMSYTYFLKLKVGDQNWSIELDRSIIDDLEVALQEYMGTKYLATLESSIKFGILCDLGQNGILGDFKISNELINDKRDWLKSYNVDVFFHTQMAEVLLEGLRRLEEFLNQQLQHHKHLKLETRSIEENLKWIRGLLDYQKKHGNLNSPGVGIENLQYLKTAAVMEIIYLENLRKNEKMPTTRRAIDKKIYEIVVEMRRAPFLDIELPPLVGDIAAKEVHE